MLSPAPKLKPPQPKSSSHTSTSNGLVTAGSHTRVEYEAPPTGRFAHNFSRIPVHAPPPITLQAKLAINTPGDIYEQEADHFAEQVMRMPEPQLQRACPCGGDCAQCQSKQTNQDPQRLQTKSVGSSDSAQTEAPPIIHEVLASSGQPLDPATRAFMEPRFGHDFSQVRVHTDAVAARSALDVNAHAYTAGHNIVFGADRFAPETQGGRRLLSHELTHVIQQRAYDNSSGGVVQRVPSTLEAKTTVTERQNIRILSSERVPVFGADDIKADMSDTKKAGLSVDAVTFSPDIPEKIKTGLQNIAARFIFTLTANTVTNIPVDLLPYGGVNGVYRFTKVERATPPKVELIIEQVSNTPPLDPGSIDISKDEKRFKAFDFTMTGFDSPSDKRLLFTALAGVPDHILNRVKGLVFAREMTEGPPAIYDPNTHIITIHTMGLSRWMNSIGASGGSWFTQAIAHELGHAIDYEAFTAARLKVAALAKQLKDAQLNARRITVDPNAPMDDTAEVARQAHDRQEIQRLQQELANAQNDFIRVHDVDNVRGAGHTQSREFSRAQGKPISGYGATAAGENFAELFSLFILDPALLKSLRPDAYQYFATTFI